MNVQNIGALHFGRLHIVGKGGLDSYSAGELKEILKMGEELKDCSNTETVISKDGVFVKDLINNKVYSNQQPINEKPYLEYVLTDEVSFKVSDENGKNSILCFPCDSADDAEAVFSNSPIRCLAMFSKLLDKSLKTEDAPRNYREIDDTKEKIMDIYG